MSGAAALHARLVITIELLLSLLAFLGLIGGLLRRPVSRFFHAGLAIAQLLILSEATLGAWRWLGGAQARQLSLHLLYAAIGCALIPAAHQYLRDSHPRRYQLGMAAACLLMLGIALRATTTG